MDNNMEDYDRYMHLPGLNYTGEDIPVSYPTYGALATCQFITFSNGDVVAYTVETEKMPEMYWSGFGKTRDEAREDWSRTLEELWTSENPARVGA